MIGTAYDVLIIGSGASGGTVARQLTQQGIRCLMLNAGPAVDFQRDRVLKKVYDLPYRGFGQPQRFPDLQWADEYNGNVWADPQKNPYTYDSGTPYEWVRVRLVGGRTLFWGRWSLRLSDYEFKAKDHDGFGENWPLAYKDLDPYYGQVEQILRVSGKNEGWPQSPDGVFLEDHSPDSTSIQRFKKSAERLSVPTSKARVATGQLASSVNRLLPEALATGRLQIVANAVVRDITVDRNTGQANGVHFIDRRTKQEYLAKARVVVLAASCLESTRILLNSGIANSSGVLGHYLFDQFYITDVVSAIVPEARGGRPPRGLMGGDGYVPRFRNLNQRDKRFIRGYAYVFSSGNTPSQQYLPGYGRSLLDRIAEVEGAGFSVWTMGETLPRYENYVALDKSVVDEWGIPVLHIRQKYSDNEIAMAKDSMETAEEICRGAGFEILAKHWQMIPAGASIHELGTCRMGHDPKTSVLNKFNQSHEVKNLFVVDGAAFVTGGSQNPTLTICALAMRSADYLAEQMRTGVI
jgi:choline dehydrogenase-like flavoprotein